MRRYAPDDNPEFPVSLRWWRAFMAHLTTHPPYMTSMEAAAGCVFSPRLRHCRISRVLGSVLHASVGHDVARLLYSSLHYFVVVMLGITMQSSRRSGIAQVPFSFCPCLIARRTSKTDFKRLPWQYILNFCLKAPVN